MKNLESQYIKEEYLDRIPFAGVLCFCIFLFVFVVTAIFSIGVAVGVNALINLITK